ncbi:hypothetical protein AAJ76_2400050597 [Vairimorpha ceranae]|uniref:Uncharacterized protein n=1 Tax=Vairimorpha ceranae TaxID=40302 RepID=A0A0F9WD36_9MICR|nr:hypothetical protein AAJ76_2400050597 [Vairimorpha ceranae]KKO75341.1 hypothetical protein AAJ76_2400050597 [Vairimorpha ceranae]
MDVLSKTSLYIFHSKKAAPFYMGTFKANIFNIKKKKDFYNYVFLYCF